MVYDLDMLKSFYTSYEGKLERVREVLNRPLTLTEKILYTHLYDEGEIKEFKRGEEYVYFRPDRVAMQDATAQMALLQFMNAGKNQVEVPTTVHCDHLIQANIGAKEDLEIAKETHKEVYDFLKDASSKYGIGFWKPGAGIIHQIVLENYAFPGGMMIGTDSHTPNAGGLGMIAIGVGGADAVDVMTNMPWELRMPKIIGVHLKGKLNGWTAPKDVILKLAGLLTVKGATNSVIEYFGEGVNTLSTTGKATICNMGAEVGATTSIFPYDIKMKNYLNATGRKEISKLTEQMEDYLTADKEALKNPDIFYDQVIEIDLSKLEPYVNGPFSPDAASPISEFAKKIKDNNYPQTVDVGLIGSCTNSSYEDITRATSIIKEVIEKEIEVKSQLLIHPGSEQIRATIERDGLINTLEKAGATVMANACGPCIGQWKRDEKEPNRKNSIINSFNRNFAKRADGNPNTHSFVASPEIVAALTVAGTLCFNPLKDTLKNKKGEEVKLSEPKGIELPIQGFEAGESGYLKPEMQKEPIEVDPNSKRIQLLKPFPAYNEKDFKDLSLLIKAKGKCTTDHISMAGPWLRFRGHLENISDNMLMGAINAFNDKANVIWNTVTSAYDSVSGTAKLYKAQNSSSIVVAEDNYGEGSSREHAAMEPRFLNVKAILVKSFARIHETNLKKQGVLAITFKNPSDYDLIQEKDKLTILGLNDFKPNKNLEVIAKHSDGTEHRFEVLHSYNKQQIDWFKAGSALNSQVK